MNLQIKLQLEIKAVKAASQELGFVANCDLDVANLCAVLAPCLLYTSPSPRD